MKRNLKTVSVAIPKKQFRQIMDYVQRKEDEPTPTVATFLRKAINEYLINRGYDEVRASFELRRGRPARKR
jgi:hypothetical protein